MVIEYSQLEFQKWKFLIDFIEIIKDFAKCIFGDVIPIVYVFY